MKNRASREEIRGRAPISRLEIWGSSPNFLSGPVFRQKEMFRDSFSEWRSVLSDTVLPAGMIAAGFEFCTAFGSAHPQLSG
jgi:hypothetical protein